MEKESIDNPYEKRETYSIIIRCKNCLMPLSLIIDKGVSVPSYLEENELTCRRCGCEIHKSVDVVEVKA